MAENVQDELSPAPVRRKFLGQASMLGRLIIASGGVSLCLLLALRAGWLGDFERAAWFGGGALALLAWITFRLLRESRG